MEYIDINKAEEMDQYYIKKSSSYWFPGAVNFNCDIRTKASIWAESIEGNSITCHEAKACGPIIVKSLKAHCIECRWLTAYEVITDKLKHIKHIDVTHLKALTATD